VRIDGESGACEHRAMRPTHLLAGCLLLLPLCMSAGPASRPAQKPYRSFDELVQSLPPFTRDPNDFQLDRIKRAVAEKVQGRIVEGRIALDSVYHDEDGSVRVRPAIRSQNGYFSSAEIYIDSPSDDLIKQFETFKRGQEFKMRCTIKDAQIRQDGVLDIWARATISPRH
jgi:hypothetical protein